MLAVVVTAPDTPVAAATPKWASWTIVTLVVLRVLYHLIYLRDVPFSVATISDGAIYERAALDLVAHPPWGTKAFYLQGLYAVQLAVPMAYGGIGLALGSQILGALFGWWLFHRVLRSMLGGPLGAYATMIALAQSAPAFYENKFLSAELTIFCSVLVLVGFAWFERAPRWPAALATGVALGLLVLARPNLALAGPPIMIALWLVAPKGRARVIAFATFAIGVVLALAPMAYRNHEVTGRATVFPSHGGGTSFYIGNNAKAQGVWNSADMFSGDVTREADEFDGTGEVIGRDSVDAERAAQMGEALYQRAWTEIAEDPGRWIWLLSRKVWLTIGNDELAQDFDVLGEREMIPWANRLVLPFGLVLALAVAGAVVWWRDPPTVARRWLFGGLAFATFAGNIVFFTSSQHRAPLVVPLSVLAAVGAVWLVQTLRDPGLRRTRVVLLAVVAAVALQGLWPRSARREPSAVHYYNLSLAYDYVGEPLRARDAVESALRRAPDHPLMLLQRAELRRRAGDFLGARHDLDRIRDTPGVPDWVLDHAMLEAESVDFGLVNSAVPRAQR